ncbi:MAG: prolyl oligopeptidase family serine peptidase [Candidatus Saccharimonadaceae bacterium]
MQIYNKFVNSYIHIHIKSVTLCPAQLITTGFNDPRVLCWIPPKYATTMQKLNEGDAPVLLYVDSDLGHMGGIIMD